MMEWQLSHKNKGIKLKAVLRAYLHKASKEFISVLEKFAEIFENNIIQFAEIRHGNNVFADKEELEELLRKLPSYAFWLKDLPEWKIWF